MSTMRTSRRHASRPPRVVNWIFLTVLRSPLHGLVDPGICELRYRGRRSGRSVALPVLFARQGDRLVVVVGDAPDKLWWRNFIEPRRVEVRRGGKLRAGICHVVAPSDQSYQTIRQAYVQRQHVSLQPTDRVLVIDIDGATESTNTARRPLP